MLRFVWPSSTQSALVCATFNQSTQVCLTLYQSKHSSVLDIQPVKALQLVWPSANQSTTVSHSDKVLKLLLASTSNSLILSPAYADQLALQCQGFSCVFFSFSSFFSCSFTHSHHIALFLRPGLPLKRNHKYLRRSSDVAVVHSENGKLPGQRVHRDLRTQTSSWHFWHHRSSHIWIMQKQDLSHHTCRALL